MRDRVWSSDLPLGEKAILQVYLIYMNASSGLAWPSTDRMCQHLSLSRPTVIRHRASLIRKGILVVVDRRANKPMKVSICLSGLVVAVTLPQHEQVKNETSSGKDMRPVVVKELYPNIAREQAIELVPPIVPPRGEVQLWEKINDLRQQHLAPGTKPLKLSDGRRRAIRGRVKESSKDDVLSVVKWFLTSSHQRAVYIRMNHSIDTVLRPSNFQNYLEFSQAPEMSPEDKFIAEMEAFEQAEEAQYGEHP